MQMQSVWCGGRRGRNYRRSGADRVYSVSGSDPDNLPPNGTALVASPGLPSLRRNAAASITERTRHLFRSCGCGHETSDDNSLKLLRVTKKLDKVLQASQPVALSSLSLLKNDMPSEQAPLSYSMESDLLI